MPVPAGYVIDEPTHMNLPKGYVLDGQGGPPPVAGVPAGVTLGQPAVHPAVSMNDVNGPRQRLLGANPVGDLGSVVGSHLKNLVTGPYHALTDAPRTPQEAAQMGTSPDSGAIARTLGHIGLAGARTLVNPTADALKALPSSKNATDVMNHLSDAVPIAGPWARSIENEAAQRGALPALAGAGIDAFAPEAVGGVLGKVREAAPSMAEGALSIHKSARGYGKTPGRAILDETKGFTPETIGAQANDTLNRLTPSLDTMAAAHPGRIDTTPAVQNIQDAIDTAAARNNRTGMDALAPVKGSLTNSAVTGLPLSPFQTATGALNLKRGLRDQFVRNWSPDAGSVLTRDTAKGASGVLDRSLDSALGPEFSSANQRISSLIPVSDAAEKLSRADELPQKFGDKLKAHTGALTSAVGGAFAGSREGGLLGGIGGGLVGFALPELMASPTSRMVMARGMNSRIPGSTLPALAAGGILTPKKKR
jgi:hypothetical protein